MNLDMGKYATEVLLSYAGTLIPLALVIWITWAQYRRAARALSAAEARKDIP